MKQLGTDLLRATPIFTSAALFAYVGLTLLLVAEQSVEFGCGVLRRKQL